MSKNMQPGAFCWNELMTSDTKKAKAFYHALFGWEYEEHDMGEMIYTMIKSATEGGGGGIFAIPSEKEGVIPPHWLSYVYVNNVDESLQKAEGLGAKVKFPATDVADYGRLAVLEDPTGAVFAIWQSLKSCD